MRHHLPKKENSVFGAGVEPGRDGLIELDLGLKVGRLEFAVHPYMRGAIVQ
jgi:hypothetical protein